MISRQMYLNLILMIGVSLMSQGCGRPKVTGNIMSPVEHEELNAGLAALDAVLKEHSPFIYERLAPSASPEDISKLRRSLGGVEVQYLESWYKWHNGCDDRLVDILPLGRMLSINESINDREAIQQIPFVHARRKRAIKLLEDLAGDGFYVDLSSSNPRVYYEMLEDPTPTDYGTMVDFLGFIVRVHSSEIASPNNKGMIEFDLEKYQKVESEYFNSLKN